MSMEITEEIFQARPMQILTRAGRSLFSGSIFPFSRENAFKVKEEMSEEVPAILKSTI